MLRLWILLLLVVLICYSLLTMAAPTTKMIVYNHAGSPIELFWLNTFSENELVLQSKKPVRNATSIPVDSYNTHEFIIKFADKTRYEQGHFMKGPRDEDIHVYFDDKEFHIKITSEYDRWVDKMEKATRTCLNDNSQSFAECMASDVFKDVSQIIDTKDAYADYHGRLSGKLRNYTCADPTMETSKPINSFEFTHDEEVYQIDTMLDLPNAKVWLAHDFITDEECEVFRQASFGKLLRATVAGHDGNAEVSNNRRAQQAGYQIPYDDPKDIEEPVWPLYNKIMTFQNTYGKLRINHVGQEGFVIIQYNPADEYTPHCDGDCDGKPHNAGGRVATAVLYCTVPEEGGGTTFTKADIFVKPVKNDATLFVYKGADGLMDNGFTEHSGCPVLKGEKWITTAWMREGVTRERDWTVIDPSGREKLPAQS